MKTDFLPDIIFCILVLPGMMFLFPLTQWIGWHPGYVLLYAAWLYLVYFLCRGVLGAQLLEGTRGILTVAGAVFLLGTLTFLMTLVAVDFPGEEEPGGGMELYQRAMWILLAATVWSGLLAGAFRTRYSRLQRAASEQAAADDAREALAKRGDEAVAGESILLKSRYQSIQVPLSAIQYLESRNNYVCVHLDHREDVVSQITLKKMESLLPEGKFVRIHKSYVVPLWRIRQHSLSEVQLLGVDTPLPVGRTYKDLLKTALS